MTAEDLCVSAVMAAFMQICSPSDKLEQPQLVGYLHP